MITRFLIFCIAFTFCEIAGAQSSNEKKIDSLKNSLPHLKDTSRINCLNSIAYLYSSSFSYHDYDSVSIYALPALAESRKLNYKKGIREALMALGNSEPITNNEIAEQHIKELISMTDEDSIIAFAQFRLAWCLSNQAKFDEAIKVGTICGEYFKKINNLPTLTAVIFGLSGNYTALGNYEKAFEYNQDALLKSKITRDKFNSIYSRLHMADFYMDVEDYKTAKKYIDDAFQINPKMIPKEKESMIPSGIGRGYLNHLGELYFHLKQYDSAIFYYQYAMKGYPNAVLYKLNIAKVYLAQKEYDKALPLLEFSRNESEKTCHQGMFMRSLLGLSEVYLNKKDCTSAYRLAKQALNLARDRGAKLIIRDACLLLAAINEDLGRMEEALVYHKKYMLLKDSIMNDQYKGKLFAFKQNAEEEVRLSEINALKNQKEISEQKLKIQQQKLMQNQLSKNVLIGGILLIVLLSFVVFQIILLKRRNERLQNQQMQVELKHKASELEMQALRAQMNPHFIFNCLSSINRFILKNEMETASDYLTRFSRLIRMVLMHSQSSLIPMKDELDMLRYYLDMEQLRFKNSFDYNISFTNSIDVETILIPPLLLQPFCENAIWHGLMHKEEHGHLEISLSKKDDLLHCLITDNGVGRAKAAELKSKSGEKQKSLGLKITAERLALINEEQGVKTSYEIEDVVENDEVRGTKVRLYMRYKDQYLKREKELNTLS